ncbi:MAG: hypothetical protein V3T53_03835 [Phycisphaerales bacterium]
MSDTKPRKPWYRPRNVLPPLLAAVLTLVGWLTYLVYWALTVEPNPSVDYAKQMQALSIDSQPKGDNGWPLLMQGLSLVHEIEEPLSRDEDSSYRLDYLNFNIIYEPNADENEVGKLNRALTNLESEGVFDLLAQAAECTNAVGPPRRSESGPLLNVLLPELGYLRLLAYARIASMHFAIAEGNNDEAIRALDETLTIARALTYQPTLIEQRSGHHLLLEICKRLRNAIKEQDIGQPILSRYLESIRRHLPLGSLTIGIEDQRLLLRDTIQYLFSDNGHGNGRLLFSQFDEAGIMNIGDISDLSWSPFGGRESFPAIANVAGIAFADRTETTGMVDRYFDASIRQAEMSREQRLANPFDEQEFYQQLNWQHPILKLLLFPMTRVIDERDEVECQIAGTILMLAIEEYRAEHGQYPATLELLVPETLQDIPSDPFSAHGFIYRITTSADDRQNYVLYSVGADGIDNNGATDSIEPRLALSDLDGFGLDFVLNAPKSEK